MAIPCDKTFHIIFFGPVTLTLKFGMIEITLTLVITYEPCEIGLHNSVVHSLQQGISHHAIILTYKPWTLTFFKNFNLGHNFWTRRYRAFFSHWLFVYQSQACILVEVSFWMHSVYICSRIRRKNTHLAEDIEFFFLFRVRPSWNFCNWISFVIRGVFI